MNEGGQSSTGQVGQHLNLSHALPHLLCLKLIDFVITTHPAYPELLKITEERKSNIHQVLHDQLVKIQEEEGAETFTDVVKDVHMYPDFHGKLILRPILHLILDPESDLSQAIALLSRTPACVVPLLD
jgi:ribulose kinase